MEPPAARPVATGSALTRSTAARWLAALLLASAALFVVPVWWGLPSVSGWAVDEILPREVVPAAAWPDKYPPLHRYLLTALAAVVEAAGRALGAAAPEVETARFLAGRLLSTAMALATLWLLYRAVRVGEDRATALWTVALTAPALPFVYYAKTANLDGPYLFWFALSALFYLRALDGARVSDYLGLGVAAACAVATKDQAFALYVLAPVALVLDLARRRRGEGRGAWRALVDHRLWLGAVAAAATLALIWWWAEDGEMSRHFAVLTSERAVGRYRVYPATLVGQWREAVSSARYLGLAVGAPTALAAVVGLTLALRRPRRYRLPLALLLTAVSYYLFFVVPIGYNYVRFLLPVLPVTALFAALAVRRCGGGSRSRVAWTVVVVVVALAWPWSRAVALDLHMLGDARYGAEDWLQSTGLASRAVALGNKLHLPRGVRTVEWKVIEEAPCRSLRHVAGAVLLVDPDEVRGPSERGLLAWVDSGLAGYGQPRRFTNRFPRGLFHRDDVLWNLDKIGREVVAYRATGSECFDASGIWRRVQRLRGGGRITDRSGLAAAVLFGLVETQPLRGERMVVAGVASDRWTRGPRPAVIVARARPGRSYRPRLEVVPPPDGPARLWVEDGGRPIESIALQPPSTSVELPEVPAGGTSLFVVWTDAAWSPETSRRVLGVRLLGDRD